MRAIAFLIGMAAMLPMSMRYPYIGVLLWGWISFMNPHELVYGFGTSLPWAYIVFGFMLVGFVVGREPKRLPNTPLVWLIIAFMICTSYPQLFALANPVMVLDKWKFVEKVCFFLLVTAAMVNTRERIHALIWVMVISLAFYGIKGGVFTLLTGGSSHVYGPPGTMISDNNQLATGLLTTMPLMNYLRLQSRHRVIRIGFVVAMVLTLFAVLGSYSRGALLGCGAVAFFFWLRGRNKLISAVAVVLVLGLGLSFMPAKWTERMYSIEHYQHDASAEGRLNIWHVTILMAEHRPLTGTGFYGPYSQNIVNLYDPMVHARAVHSIWFEILGENGIPALLAWAGMSFVTFLNTRRILKYAKGVEGLAWARDFALMAQVSMIGFLTAGSFLSMCYWDFYMTLLVVVGAVWELVRAEVRPRAAAWAPIGASDRLAVSR